MTNETSPCLFTFFYNTSITKGVKSMVNKEMGGPKPPSKPKPPSDPPPPMRDPIKKRR